MTSIRRVATILVLAVLSVTLAGTVRADVVTNWNAVATTAAATPFVNGVAYIAHFDTKYLYNFWRPVTAIRAADTDGNDDTVPDPTWTAYLVTPNIPDYPSGHATAGAAAAEVLSRFFKKDALPFSSTSGAPFPGITRTFESFWIAAEENAASRVYAGIHFRTATLDGLRLGERVGRFAFTHVLKPAD